LARDPVLIDIPVVLMTGTTPAEQLSAKAVLLKPVTPDSLIETVEKYCPQ
jgi:CheY-like chemotaxis protein